MKCMRCLSLNREGMIISSTRIRQLVGEGKLNEAARLLGRGVSVSGTVVKGSQRGKSLGYPNSQYRV